MSIEGVNPVLRSARKGATRNPVFGLLVVLLAVLAPLTAPAWAQGPVETINLSLGLGVGANLALLAWFKYAGFLLETYLADTVAGAPFIAGLELDETAAIVASVAFLLSLAVRRRMPAGIDAEVFARLLGRKRVWATRPDSTSARAKRPLATTVSIPRRVAISAA